jgi:hypothetical protein
VICSGVKKGKTKEKDDGRENQAKTSKVRIYTEQSSMKEKVESRRLTGSHEFSAESRHFANSSTTAYHRGFSSRFLALY